MTWKKYGALARRELLEQRVGTLYTPIIVAALIVVMTTVSLISAEFGEISFGGQERQAGSFGELLRILSEEPADERSKLMSVLLLGVFFPVFLVMPFIIFFTLLGSLYEDRRDRSFLFWKSMPVSDTEEVLARFLGGAILPQLSSMAVTLIGALVLLVLVSVVGGLQGGPLGPLWSIGPFVLIWLKSLIYVPLTTLWWLPVLGWILFASALAPRAPFAFCVLPPVLIGALEWGLLGSGHFGRWIGQQMAYPIKLEGKEIVGREIESPADFFEAMEPSIGDMFSSFGEPRFYAGVVLGAAFIAASIWRRRFTS